MIRFVALIALLGLAVAPAAADVSVGVRFGKSFLLYDRGDVAGRVVLGNPYRYRHRYRRYPHGTRTRRTPFLGQTGQLHSRIGAGRRTSERRHDEYYHDYDYHTRGRLFLLPRAERPEVTPTPLPPEPEVVAPPAAVEETPPEPLDPAGSARMVTARGVVLGPRYAVGDALPASQPYVILDPVRHGLPQPPEGELYARVRRDVFRIRIGSREIVEKVTP